MDTMPILLHSTVIQNIILHWLNNVLIVNAYPFQEFDDLDGSPVFIEPYVNEVDVASIIVRILDGNGPTSISSVHFTVCCHPKGSPFIYTFLYTLMAKVMHNLVSMNKFPPKRKSNRNKHLATAWKFHILIFIH